LTFAATEVTATSKISFGATADPVTSKISRDDLNDIIDELLPVRYISEFDRLVDNLVQLQGFLTGQCFIYVKHTITSWTMYFFMIFSMGSNKFSVRK